MRSGNRHIGGESAYTTLLLFFFRSHTTAPTSVRTASNSKSAFNANPRKPTVADIAPSFTAIHNSVRTNPEIQNIAKPHVLLV